MSIRACGKPPFECELAEDRDAFAMPDFCLVHVTQEEFVAGGYLAGKSCHDIAAGLQRCKY